MKRWVVRRGDGAIVGDLLAKMNEDARAIDEGRVFLGRKRVVRAAEPVRIGDEVQVGRASASASAPSVEIPIVHDDDGLLVCIKPAGMPTVPDHAGASHSLVAMLARATARSAGDLRVTSRLDREVSGVVVFATDALAEARLRQARVEGAYTRRYVAIAAYAAALPDHGTWDAPIGEGADPRHRAANGPRARPSQTHFRVVARCDQLALLAVEPATGRTHQIRIHAAHAGAPLFGDRDYGGPTRLTLAGGRVVSLARIALHCARIVVPRANGTALTIDAPISSEIADLWRALGGGGGDVDDAASGALRS